MVPMVTTAVRENPYTIGVPVAGPQSLFGREDVLESVRMYLLENAPVTVIAGQRRIGKSSVLRHLGGHSGLEGHRFVYFDLQARESCGIGELLHDLGTAIAEGAPVPAVPAADVLEAAPSRFVSDFLLPSEDPRTLVLLLDEFDALGFDAGPATVGDAFARLLLWALDRIANLRVIVVVGRHLDQMDRLPARIKAAPQQRIGLLDPATTRRLIAEPAQGRLRYEPEAVDAIGALTGGHPYFIQLLCFCLFQRAKDRGDWVVREPDVQNAIPEALTRGRGGLTWFREGLPLNERVLFSAYAEAPGSAESAWQAIKGAGAVPTEPLQFADRRLRDWGYLTKDGTPEVELVRRWISREYPLREEIRLLERAEPEADESYRSSRKSSDPVGRIALLEACLNRNPNHMSAVADLAEQHLEAENFEKAVVCYRRAWLANPGLKSEYLRALNRLSEQEIRAGDLEAARRSAEETLRLDPESEAARALVEEARARLSPFFVRNLTGWWMKFQRENAR